MATIKAQKIRNLANPPIEPPYSYKEPLYSSIEPPLMGEQSAEYRVGERQDNEGARCSPPSTRCPLMGTTQYGVMVPLEGESNANRFGKIGARRAASR